MAMTLRNIETHETAPAHVIGTTTDGDTLVRFAEGWEPDDFNATLTEDGWVVVDDEEPEEPEENTHGRGL
jgi:hypothetical protein